MAWAIVRFTSRQYKPLECGPSGATASREVRRVWGVLRRLCLRLSRPDYMAVQLAKRRDPPTLVTGVRASRVLRRAADVRQPSPSSTTPVADPFVCVIGSRPHAHEPLEGIVQHTRSRLIPPPISAKPVHVSTPPCPYCGSADTEPSPMMRRYTCDADAWIRCTECGQTFTAPRWPLD